jgi:hypothetical protein
MNYIVCWLERTLKSHLVNETVQVDFQVSDYATNRALLPHPLPIPLSWFALRYVPRPSPR